MKLKLFVLCLVGMLSVFAQDDVNFKTLYYPAGATEVTVNFLDKYNHPISLDIPTNFDSCTVTFQNSSFRSPNTFNIVKFMSDTLQITDVRAAMNIVLEPARFAGFVHSWKIVFSVAQSVGGYIVVGYRKY